MKDKFDGQSDCGRRAKVDDARLTTLLRKLADNSEELSILDVLPCLNAVAQDKGGSQFLQAHLPLASKEVQAIVFGAMLPDVVTLSQHQHGHSFILQVLEVATPEQMMLLEERLSPHVKVLTLDSNGCRVIQRAIQLMPHHSREHFIEGLKENITQCIKSMHGNHVIQVCIQEMCPAFVGFMVDAIVAWGADQASAHMYACRVVMRLLEHAQRQQIKELLQQILQAVPKLAQDRYGNYVLQHILQHMEVGDRSDLIFKVIQCGVPLLARQKYAHNVVVKCIEVTWSPDFQTTLESQRESLSLELLWKDAGSPIVELANDRFGAMVVECLMEHLTGPTLDRLELVLHESENCLSESQHAATILTKLHAEH
jgi:hypothetical protein